jgi:hypothetical protein
MMRGSDTHLRLIPALCRRAVVVLCVAAVASLGAAAAATATTGPGYLLKNPGFKVTHQVAKPFVGVFKFNPVGSSRNMVNASMFADFQNQPPEDFMIGQIQVYAYDRHGQEGDWVGTMYNWHWTGKAMQMELVGFGGSPVLGYMVLKARDGGKHLTGTLVTRSDNEHYAVSFTRTKLRAPSLGA